MQDRFRPIPFLADDLDIQKTMAAAPAGPHGFEKSFLGGEPGSEPLCSAAAGFTKRDLAGSEYPVF